MSFVSPLLGFILGAWLILAGARKFTNPSEFKVTVASLLSSATDSPMTRAMATAFPLIEIVVGAAACIAYDVTVIRTLVLALFSIFLVALVMLAFRFKRFDCGCFAAGRAEPRELIVLRGTFSALLAVLLVVARPSDHVFTSYSKVWFECLAWSSLFIGLVASHAREVIGSATGEAL
jgi:hypothetical protein